MANRLLLNSVPPHCGQLVIIGRLLSGKASAQGVGVRITLTRLDKDRVAMFARFDVPCDFSANVRDNVSEFVGDHPAQCPIREFVQGHAGIM